MEDNRNILGILSSAVGEYLSLRTDDFRKNIITGLSTGFSRVLVILVIALLLLIVLGVLAFGFIVLLGEAIGSLSGAAFIVGGAYLIGVIILIALRKRLFLTMFTNLFSEIMETDSQAQNWKPLLLTLVKRLRSAVDS